MRGSAEAAPLPEALLAEIVRLAVTGYPEEVCGLVVGRRAEPASYTLRPLRNAAETARPRDPEGRPRNAASAYWADPLELLRVLREAEAAGWELVTLYHSHPEAAANFSRMDRAYALTPDGEPWWPGMDYLVVSIRGGRGAAARVYAWDGSAGEFVGREVRLPEAQGDRRMAVTVRIPTPLRTLTGGRGEVAVEGATLREVVEALERTYPGLQERLCEADGSVRGFLNIYVNDQDIRFLQGAQTPLQAGDEVTILPAMSGGA